MTARKMFWFGALIGIGSLALDHVLVGWIYNDLQLERALALTAITHPVLVFLGTAGAALVAVSVLFSSIARRDSAAGGIV